MPESWYLMSQPLFNSGFEGDEFSAFAQGGFEEILDSPLADEIEIYEKTLSATPVSARAIIQGVTADNYNNSVLRQFLCKIGTLRSGQYIKARGHMWLVYSLLITIRCTKKRLLGSANIQSSLFHRPAEKLLSTLFMISIVRSMALVKHLKTI